MEEPVLAVALRYAGDDDDIPRITASGRGAVARQICEVAEAHGVTVRRDGDLARVLAELEVGSPIPLAAFAAVAEILAHLYRTNAAMAGSSG